MRAVDGCDHFGVFLSHLYTNTGLVPAGLKGADRKLYDFLTTKGIPVSLVGVFSHVKYINWMFDGIEDCYSDRDPKYQNIVSIAATCVDTRLPVHKDVTNIPFFTPWSAAESMLRCFDTPAAHTGNEVEKGNAEKLYLRCAMIIGPVHAPEAHNSRKEV
jgi:hypothetical protein